MIAYGNYALYKNMYRQEVTGTRQNYDKSDSAVTSTLPVSHDQ